MKGVILAAGKGTRLLPLTKTIPKHLLPIYDKPTIYYPIIFLKKCGIKDMLIIVDKNDLEITKKLLGDGKEFGINIYYEIQTGPYGMTGALACAEKFANGENISVAVCDNIFGEIPDVKNFKKGARFFFKETSDANKYTVAEIEDKKLINLEEKPENPKSNYALTGFYLYDKKIFSYIKNLKPSVRRELELAEANNLYIKNGECEHRILKGFWIDTGTFESLHRASELVKNNAGELSETLSF